ncbi:hypothetical protein ACH5RR_013259 [Cinchona calisaya]|uniref:Uncharacterized protein n=1 Tax=Cinchona calisaya TaxID=153742 RepID=A0ABD3A272_9GENT
MQEEIADVNPRNARTAFELLHMEEQRRTGTCSEEARISADDLEGTCFFSEFPNWKLLTDRAALPLVLTIAYPLDEVNVEIDPKNIELTIALSGGPGGDRALPLERDGSSLVIHVHLQVQSADCSHLSFGSLGSSEYSSFANILPHFCVEILSIMLMSRSKNALDGNLFHGSSASPGNYDSSSPSQPQPLKMENLEVERANHYAFPSSTLGYAFENS